jgi:raffinose/stachyose/melibiose transport system permease protein
VLLADPNLFPVTRALYSFEGSSQQNWPLLAAAIVIVSLPIVLLFAASQRQLIRARFIGSVKG